MITTQPSYYDNFTCIADKCSFTCCREWKIAVDNNTYDKWKSLGLSDFTEASDDGEYQIRLGCDGRCPLLTEEGLCEVVLKHGEESISKTCHTFPREEHAFDDRTERTISMGCPAALDLLWADDKWNIVQSQKSDDIYFKLRDNIYDLISNRDFSIAVAMKTAFYILLDLLDKEYDGYELGIEDIDELFKPEVIGEIANTIIGIEGDTELTINEQNELFLDLADNYRKKKIYSDVLEPLATRATMYEEESMPEDRHELFEKEWNDCESYIRSLIREEVFSTLLLPEGDLYSMVMKMQWIAITYSTIKQCLFLWWDEQGNITYEAMRHIVAVIIRMTGYSEADIEEYLENSFQEIIWEWGYYNLIVD